MTDLKPPLAPYLSAFLDIYDTYDAAQRRAMITLLQERDADMTTRETPPKPPSVAAAVAPSREWANMQIARERMVEVGLSEGAARLLAPNGSIAWHALARQDGMLALACLPDDKLADITAQLRTEGAPPATVNTPAGVAHMLYVAAESHCPTTEGWNSRGLTSAVATALLLRLAESVWREKQIITGLGAADRRWLNTH